MKQINYSGSSKLISKIVNLLNRKAPLPLDGDGDPDWGTNGQVLSTDGNGNTAWVNQGGGGDVTDVEVNGTSVVNAQGVAEVSVPTKTSDLNNDSDFIDSTDLSTALADYTPTASLASVATSGQYSDLSGTPSLATVATSGDYDDLTNKPTIPAAQVNSDWNAVSGVAQILNKPTIPTVNDGTLTIQQNGTTVGTFSANQSGNTTVNLTGGGSTYTEGDGINISAQNAISVDTAFTEASARANIASGDTLSTIWGKIKKFFSDLKTVAFTGSYNDLTDKPSVPGGENYVLKAGDTMSGDLTIDRQNGTTTAEGFSYFTIGNNIPMGTDKNSTGIIRLFSDSDKLLNLYFSGSASANRNIGFPDKSGTVALTSDLPDMSTKVSKSGDTMSGTLNMNTANGVAMDFRPTNSYNSTTISCQTGGNGACVFATKASVSSWIFINGEDSIANHANNRWQSLVPGLQIKNNCVAIGKLIGSGVTPTYTLDVGGTANATDIKKDGVTVPSIEVIGSIELSATTSWQTYVGTSLKNIIAAYCNCINASANNNFLYYVRHPSNIPTRYELYYKCLSGTATLYCEVVLFH